MTITNALLLPPLLPILLPFLCLALLEGWWPRGVEVELNSGIGMASMLAGFSADLRLCVSGQQRTEITVTEFDTQRILCKLDSPVQCLSAAISWDNRLISAGHSDGTVQVRALPLSTPEEAQE